MIVDELRKLQLPLQNNILSNGHKWVGLFFQIFSFYLESMALEIMILS